MIREFYSFIQRGSAIDMAVGIIIGSVMTGMVNSLVKDVMMPPIGVLMGGIDFSQWFYVLSGGEQGVVYETIAQAQAAGASTLNIGVFLNTVVSFFITMFAVFLIVRTMNRVRAKQPSTTHECPYCTSKINNSATKCPFCCSVVKAVKTAPVEDSDVQKTLKKVKKRAAKIVKTSVSKIKEITDK
ncbi:MAG: large conductance mechanosensitive channel protein MscL [Alphaproteobacteria bacterium]|nr:large conductance mechanosensitive channel protein MscL [Alphaproteobacteria bacterium]